MVGLLGPDDPRGPHLARVHRRGARQGALSPRPRRAEPRRISSAANGPAGAGRRCRGAPKEHEREARKAFDRAAASGLPLEISPIDVGGQARYRVRAGPYGTREEAEKAARPLNALRFDTWITVR